MVLRNFCKQLWFIVLMVFSIGCSGISVAIANTMHLDMQHQSSIHTNTSTHISQQQEHCTHIAGLNTDHHQSPALKNCNVLKMAQHDGMQHICQDCALSFCQSLVTWMQTDAINLPQTLPVTQTQAQIDRYQAQHLLGHWQEIRRPPKV